jgi:hypothetical protein
MFVWALKRSVINRIKDTAAAAIAGEALYGVVVEYALPPNPERVCVYGSRARSTRTQVSAEHGVLFREDTLIDIRVRVQELGGDIADTEMVAEGICQAIAVAVTAEPRLTPGGSVAVTATDQDPTIISPDPDPYVTVNVVLTVSLSMFTRGS